MVVASNLHHDSFELQSVLCIVITMVSRINIKVPCSKCNESIGYLKYTPDSGIVAII